jgi:DNA-binding transcriptional regulator YdaS (Cro superfamily)
MTADDVRAMLRRACKDAGSQSAWADLHNLSAAYVSDVINGRRDPGDAICSALEIKAELSFRKVKP